MKEKQASMVDVIMNYESIETSLEVGAVGKVNYKHLQEQNN